MSVDFIDNFIDRNDIEEYILDKFENDHSLFPRLKYEEINTKKVTPKNPISADWYECNISYNELLSLNFKIQESNSNEDLILFCKHKTFYISQKFMYKSKTFPDKVVTVRLLVIALELLEDSRFFEVFNIPKPSMDIPKFKLYCPSKTLLATFEEPKVINLPEISTRCYCINLPYEYFSLNLQKWLEYSYSFKEQAWRISYDNLEYIKNLIKDIGKRGLQNPLCFALSSKGQLVSLACNSRMFLAKYLGLDYVPAIICISDRFNFNDAKQFINEEQDVRALANKCLAPYILYNI